MYRPKKSVLSYLLLAILLLAGTLQTQTVYACAMMNTVMHGDCCCDDHGDCAASDFSDTIYAEDVPCCERTVELTNNSDTQQAVPLGKQRIKIRSDVDPPTAITATDDFLAVPGNFTFPVIFPATKSSVLSGSDIYLITQRLRI
jgi:hypothetical protein